MCIWHALEWVKRFTKNGLRLMAVSLSRASIQFEETAQYFAWLVLST